MLFTSSWCLHGHPAVLLLACSMLALLTLVTAGLTFNCTDPPLEVEYKIAYYSGKVDCGNLLLESDIGGTHPWIPPKVTFPSADPKESYALMYIDPYVDLPNNGTWPDVTTPGSKAPARHWVVGNILGSHLASGDLSAATTVSKFKGPSPPWGSHPYGLFLFKQAAAAVPYPTLPSPLGIYNWDYDAFISQHQLSLVASNWHVTQHMEPRHT